MTRPMTMAEKILAAHAGLDEVEPGQLIECDLDLVLANDITGPLAIKSFRVYLCLMTLATVNKAAFIFLQSMGKPWASTLLSMVREVVFGVGFALLLPRMFGLDGVLYSMPVSDALTFVISVCLILRTWRELKVDDSGRVYPA